MEGARLFCRLRVAAGRARPGCSCACSGAAAQEGPILGNLLQHNEVGQPAGVLVHLPMALPARRGQDLSSAPTPAAAFAESPGPLGTKTAPGWAGLGCGAAGTGLGGDFWILLAFISPVSNVC